MSKIYETQEFNGRVFVRLKPNDYFRCFENGRALLMHRCVWEYYNGEIPKGYDIHHKDNDRANNSIDNLDIMENREHRKYHAEHMSDEERKRRKDNMLKNAMPKAIEWHKSEDGHNWHSKHLKQQHKNGAFKKNLICTCCGKSYIGEISGKNGNHFCSNACKSKYRRRIGADLVDAICPVCNNVFRTDKLRPSTTCSRSCANRYRAIMKREAVKKEIPCKVDNLF